MKTFRIFFIGMLITGMSVQAQKIYIRGGLGISVSTSANYAYEHTTTSGTNIVAVKKQGLGTGLPIVIAAGYKINDHFGVELGIDYFYGFPIKYSDDTYSYTNDSKYNGQMLSLVPAFVMTLPLDKFKPYARLGLKLGVFNSVIYNKHEIMFPDKSTTSIDSETKSKDYGGMAIGAQAAVGTDFVISDLMSFFGEIQVDGISFAPKHGKYPEYNINGEDKLSTLNEKDKKWDYVKEVDFNKTIPNDKPDQVNKVNHRFGNVGLVIGVTMNL
jgi:hypothetical protein